MIIYFKWEGNIYPKKECKQSIKHIPIITYCVQVFKIRIKWQVEWVQWFGLLLNVQKNKSFVKTKIPKTFDNAYRSWRNQYLKKIKDFTFHYGHLKWIRDFIFHDRHLKWIRDFTFLDKSMAKTNQFRPFSPSMISEFLSRKAAP